MLAVPAAHGDPVYVDPDRIIAVMPAADGEQGCVLLLDGGWRVTTVWTYSELSGALSNYPSHP